MEGGPGTLSARVATTVTVVRRIEGAQVERIDQVADVMDQMPRREPLAKAGREQQQLVRLMWSASDA